MLLAFIISFALNSSRPDVSEPARDMSVEEIKEFMEEQRKRFSGYGSDDDYDDYYDNDAEIDYGDDPNDEDDAVPSSQTSRVHQVLSSPSHQIQVRYD